jgi:glutamyl-tRNA reductase
MSTLLKFSFKSGVGLSIDFQRRCDTLTAMRLVCFSVNFHTASLEAREAVCLDESGQRAVLNHLKSANESLEAIVLCTCNRTEIYLNYPDKLNPQILVDKALFDVVPTALISWRQHRQVMEDIAAVEHLFSVAAGLESQMLGENQIVRQLKDAYSLSIECGMSRFFFHKLMHAVFHASKAVRQATKITCGAVSLSMAAIEAVRTKINLCGANVLLVGAGENATLAAKYLQKENIGKLTIASRTLSSARRLAGQFKNAKTIAIRQVGEFLADADVAIFSTASPIPVLTTQEAGYYLARRKSAILIIDMAVPRDVEPQVGQLANVELINIEQLHSQVEKNRQARAVWIEPAQKIIAGHTERFAKWLESLDTSATVAQLTNEILSEAQRYAGRYRRYFAKKDQKRLEQFAEGLARKLIHRPIQYLKSPDADKASAAELVSNLFLAAAAKKAKP